MKKQKDTPGRLVMSWVVLLICYFIARLIGTFLVWMVIKGIGYIAFLPWVLRILIYLVCGSVFLSLNFLPLRLGPFLCYSASEAVCPSLTGRRYYFISALSLITGIIGIVYGIIFHAFAPQDIYIVVFALAFLLQTKKLVNS